MVASCYAERALSGSEDLRLDYCVVRYMHVGWACYATDDGGKGGLSKIAPCPQVLFSSSTNTKLVFKDF